MEIAIVSAVILAAVAFAGWRVWRTLRVAAGRSEACGGCEKC